MADATTASHCLSSEISIAADVALPPEATMPCATDSAAAPLISAQITVAPSSANRIALASPIPEPAPVTIATFLSTRI